MESALALEVDVLGASARRPPLQRLEYVPAAAPPGAGGRAGVARARVRDRGWPA